MDVVVGEGGVEKKVFFCVCENILKVFWNYSKIIRSRRSTQGRSAARWEAGVKRQQLKEKELPLRDRWSLLISYLLVLNIWEHKMCGFHLRHGKLIERENQSPPYSLLITCVSRELPRPPHPTTNTTARVVQCKLFSIKIDFYATLLWHILNVQFLYINCILK